RKLATVFGASSRKSSMRTGPRLVDISTTGLAAQAGTAAAIARASSARQARSRRCIRRDRVGDVMAVSGVAGGIGFLAVRLLRSDAGAATGEAAPLAGDELVGNLQLFACAGGVGIELARALVRLRRQPGVDVAQVLVRKR